MPGVDERVNPTSLTRRFLALFDRYIFRITVVALIAAFQFLFFLDRMVVQVPAGHSAVLWKRFGGGTVTSRTYGEGLHIIWPWNVMTVYDIRFQAFEKEFVAPDREGLPLTLRVSVRLRLEEAALPRLHQAVGPNYLQVIVVPEVGSHARQIVASYTAEEVYSIKRSDIEREMLDTIRKEAALSHGDDRLPALDYVYLEDILLRDIVLPPLVATAIEQKVQQHHVAKEWEYRLQRERLESQRKEIEGEGIARFQARVIPGISEQYLRWKGIDATLKLAESANSKTVIIGSGPSGLPVILGNEGGPPPGAAGPTTAPAPRPPGPRARADAPVEVQPSRSSQDAPRAALSAQVLSPRDTPPSVETPPPGAAPIVTPPAAVALTPSVPVGPAAAAPAPAPVGPVTVQPPAPPPTVPPPSVNPFRAFIERLLGLGG